VSPLAVAPRGAGAARQTPDAGLRRLQPMKLQIDEEAAKTFIYPTNKELRDYQFNIVKRALFS